ITDGLFNVLLGSHIEIPPQVFDSTEVYLALKVESDEEMEPRKQLVSVGYAFHALNADSLGGKSASDFVQSDLINIVSSVDGVVNDGGDIDLVEGANITITPDDAANTITISAGLTLPEILSSIDGVVNDGGNVDLVEGSNITITPDDAANTITISAAGGTGGDDLGNHTATQNIALNGNWISNDGEDEGIQITNAGKVHIVGVPGGLYEVDVTGEIHVSNGIESGNIRSTGTIMTGTPSSTHSADDLVSTNDIIADDAIEANGDGSTYAFMGGAGDAVYGLHRFTSNLGKLGTGDYGAYGIHNSTNYFGYLGSSDYGAYGQSSSMRYGCLGLSTSGVFGRYNTSIYGYLGTSSSGVYGQSSPTIFGRLGSTSYGAWGRSASTIYGYLGGTHGAYGQSSSTRYGYLGSSNYGAYGQYSSTTYGVLGAVNIGCYGTGGSFAVSGYRDSDHYGTLGTATHGVYSKGNCHVSGTLSKTAGSFKIDHPLEPTDKYLQHSFVESPDMMNIYNGNVTLDGNGMAVVKLPDYFNALNRDFRYQLTAIRAPSPNLYIAEEISDNQFKIAGGEPGKKVSWQVTGIRHDPYAEANRIQVEVEKEGMEFGKYQHPEVYGLPIEMSTDYDKILVNQEMHQQVLEENKRTQEEQERSLMEQEFMRNAD
ncbi:hypothetical protein HQ585_13110, partial [candidate division KSB1 bacterium]|nr:hypothetical protein [candidate division KSB1 bacterium]